MILTLTIIGAIIIPLWYYNVRISNRNRLSPLV